MMAKKASVSDVPKSKANSAVEGGFGAELAERLVRVAAYYRYEQRGYEHGHDVDDWLAAEASLFSEGSALQPPELTETLGLNVQESAAHGFGQDDVLKRIIKQHPRKGIPQVDSIDPQDAPPKE